jgi:hypothetical protein
VVNVLASQERPTDSLLNDPSVFKHGLVVDPNPGISTGVQLAGHTHRPSLARERAIYPSVRLGVRKRDATERANTDRLAAHFLDLLARSRGAIAGGVHSAARPLCVRSVYQKTA